MMNPHKHPKREELRKIFNLTVKQATLPRIRKNTLAIKEAKEWRGKLITYKLYEDDFHSQITQRLIDEQNEIIERLERNTKFLKQYIKESEEGNVITAVEYDKDAAKRYPCRRILEEHHIPINHNKQFKLRNENTPSCYLYEDDNRWYDFGASEGGDSISLYMKINQCDFIEALKYLTL